MKHPDQMRGELQTAITHALERVRIRCSMYLADDLEVLKALERPQQFDLGVNVTNFVMAQLGHITSPKEPRFDKTRRLFKKRNGRPPKGLTPEERANWYKEPANAEA